MMHGSWDSMKRREKLFLFDQPLILFQYFIILETYTKMYAHKSAKFPI